MGKGGRNKKARRVGVSGNPATRTRTATPLSALGISEDESFALALLMKEEDEVTILKRFQALFHESLNLGKPSLLQHAMVAVQRNEHVTFELLVMVELAIRSAAANAKDYASEFDEVYEEYRPPHSDLFKGVKHQAHVIETFITIVADSKSEARIAALWQLAASHIIRANPANADRIYDAFVNHEHADGGVLADVALTR